MRQASNQGTKLMEDSLQHMSAHSLSVADIFRSQVAMNKQAIAVEQDGVQLTYGQLEAKTNRLANYLASQGVATGDRVAMYSENRREYLELFVACAKLGAIVACVNWRQSQEELDYCVGLVAPKLILVSSRYLASAKQLEAGKAAAMKCLGTDFEATLVSFSAELAPRPVNPEDPLYIIYTSGTTGRPKGAMISHRALLARGAMWMMDGGFRRGRTFAAWSPLFHQASADSSMTTLLSGGKVIVVDGMNLDALCHIAEHEPNLGWFTLMPGMIDRFLAEVRRRGIRPRPMDSIGCMADLVPRHQIAEVTELFNSPFRNTFGSTETGPAPGGGALVPVGEIPSDLAKRQSSMSSVRLVNTQGIDVADGEPGELLLRAPTLFSGYWGAPEATSEVFTDGWYHSGDVFIRLPDGRLQFVDRRKYLIKSGGENIYPAEIEKVLLESPHIDEVAVVRMPDPKWGEVPVAFVVRNDETLSSEGVLDLCRGRIANYKIPRRVVFLSESELPRSTTGKVIRGELEERLSLL